jgi:Ca-activated chloride channel homolog
VSFEIDHQEQRTMRKKLTAFAIAIICIAPTGFAESFVPRMSLEVSPVHGLLKAGEKQSTWIRVGVTGFERPSEGKRSPINVGIVLDRSGSMQGEKIRRAREAAIDAVRMLDAQDIVSIVTYDTVVEVLVPATRLTDPEMVIKAIRTIQARGNTALFAGVSKGAAEVRKFRSEDYVNRVILLSDGLANSGPSSPGELGALGASLKKENITVSTLGLGLGYNEDLMVQLAGKSGGNHHFIEQASELADVFRSEFDDVLSVVAQGVDLKVTVPEGVRPVRVLGNSSDINGQEIVTRMSQVYGGQNKYVVIELEVPPGETAGHRDLAAVSVSYANMVTNATDHLTGQTGIGFSDSDEEIEKSLNTEVMANVVALISSEQNKLATRLLDQGDVAGCRLILQENGVWLKNNALVLKRPELDVLAITNEAQLKILDGVSAPSEPGAVEARKGMRRYQIGVDTQQKVDPQKPVAPPVKPSSSPRQK